MIQPCTRLKDWQTQEMQGCIFEAIRAISDISNMLLDLKTSKDQLSPIL